MLKIIKSIIKRNKTIWRVALRFSSFKRLANLYKYEYDLYRKHSVSFRIGNKQEKELDILVISHIIEKGIAHRKFRTSFAKEKVSQLSNLINEYYKYTSYDDFILKMGIDALKQYHKKNSEYNVDVSSYCYWPTITIKADETFVETTDMTGDEIFKYANSNFFDFASNRCSVRPFESSSAGIDRETIINSIELAMTSPSACNRQSTKVYAVFDEELISRVATLQSGSKGFGENSDVLLVLTSNLSLYANNDRRLPLIDSGIFTMNLVYSLYYYQIASCILNGSLPVSDELRIKEMLNIPENEIVSTIIAANNLNINEYYKIGKAKRRKSSDIITMI